MKRRKQLDKPQKIRTSIEELEVLAHLKETVEWVIAKRLANRYRANLMKIAFNLPENSKDFRVRHTELTGEAAGIRKFIAMIDKSGKKLKSMEK